MVELVGIGHFLCGFGDPLLDSLGAVSSAGDKPFAQLLHGRGLDEYGQCLVSELLLEIHAALDIHIEYYHVALVPDPFDFRLECSIE